MWENCKSQIPWHQFKTLCREYSRQEDPFIIYARMFNLKNLEKSLLPIEKSWPSKRKATNQIQAGPFLKRKRNLLFKIGYFGTQALSSSSADIVVGHYKTFWSQGKGWGEAMRYGDMRPKRISFQAMTTLFSIQNVLPRQGMEKDHSATNAS